MVGGMGSRKLRYWGVADDAYDAQGRLEHSVSGTNVFAERVLPREEAAHERLVHHDALDRIRNRGRSIVTHMQIIVLGQAAALEDAHAHRVKVLRRSRIQ